MPGIESILPQEHQFNESVRVFRDELVEQFADEAERTGDVLDINIEFARSPEDVWALSGLLANIFKSEDELSEEVQGAVYRGLNFGLQLSEAVMEGPLRSISLGQWVQDENSLSAQELATAICVDVQTYLGDRPDVDALVGFFMSEISQEAYMLHQHHIETAAGLMLMLCERQQAEAYLQARTELISLDDLSAQTGYTEEDN